MDAVPSLARCALVGATSLALATAPAVAVAQAHADHAAAGTAAAARQPARPSLSAAEQVAMAVLPLPTELRDGATVLGYDAAGALVTLREGSNAMRCLATPPARNDLHVACYHKGLEPFMARGRALRAQGVAGEKVDSVRFQEVAAGKLAMPRTGGALYTLTAPAGSWNAQARTLAGARPLFVYYMPFATGASTGLSEKPSAKEPWLMFPGTAKAHVMLVGTMAP